MLDVRRGWCRCTYRTLADFDAVSRHLCMSRLDPQLTLSTYYGHFTRKIFT